MAWASNICMGRGGARAWAAAVLAIVGLTGGCPEPGGKANGAVCDLSADCDSGLCYGGVCVDPAGDEDGDGLINGTEASLGSDASAADSDGDGVLDPDELGPSGEPLDEDGDGKLDIVESLLADADGDCLVDQRDPDDAVAARDGAGQLETVCAPAGICAEQRALLRVVCDADGAPSCVYDEVVGYAEPEAACDGLDENCDGATDEAFPGGCGGEAAQTWRAPSAGGGRVETGRYQATIMVGPAPSGVVGTDKHRVQIGATPAAPAEAP